MIGGTFLPDFRIHDSAPMEFNSIKVGRKMLADDVTAGVDEIIRHVQRTKPYKKEDVYRAIRRGDLVGIRAISNYFFKADGIYSRLCRYMAYLFRYDWFVTPMRLDERVPDKKVRDGWYKSLVLLDGCELKKMFGSIALKVMRNGCYYGYMLRSDERVLLQELPVNYCRSRYELNGSPAVEMNMRYFDDNFPDASYRMRVVQMFPEDVRKAYVQFKSGNLPKDFSSDDEGWVLLDPKMTVKFSLGSGDIPLFASVIPDLMDLDDAQELDKRKMAQQLVRIIVQQLPMNKNGDSVFDMSEAAQMHSNAVNMVGQAMGVSVLTTFADVEVADMSDKGNVSSVDQLDKVERTVYNEAGVSQMQFNSSGSVALEKSIANDEATMSALIDQFKLFGQRILEPMNGRKKKLYYEFSILPTTIYNYKDMAKLYKEQATLGFGLMMPQVALGRSPLAVISEGIFEGDIMHMTDIFRAPQMSSTMSGSSDSQSSGTGEAGRPSLPDDEKSDKTLANIESAQ